jgi:hypothetical protein
MKWDRKVPRYKIYYSLVWAAAVLSLISLAAFQEVGSIADLWPSEDLDLAYFNQTADLKAHSNSAFNYTGQISQELASPQVSTTSPVVLVENKHKDGKNWSVVKWFASSPSDAELSRLLPALTNRKARLMYLVNPETGQWSECLVSWKEGTWQHKATMILQEHAERASRAEKSTDVARVTGYVWGFGSGISLLAKSVVHAVVNDRMVNSNL